MLNDLIGRETVMVSRSSYAAYQTALQHARIVVQTQNSSGSDNRETFRADNLLWVRQHRGATGRIMYWAHNEHVTVGPMVLGFAQKATGQLLDERTSSYFALGTMTSTGTYAVWEQIGNTPTWERVVREFPALSADMSENEFREHPASILLIPLRGAVPEWLSTPAKLNFAGTSTANSRVGSLPAKFDAVIWIEHTTPTTPIQR